MNMQAEISDFVPVSGHALVSQSRRARGDMLMAYHHHDEAKSFRRLAAMAARDGHEYDRTYYQRQVARHERMAAFYEGKAS